MQQMIWHWKAWENVKPFCMYCFSQFFTVLSQFRKWRKTYFHRNFYELYRNWAINIPLKSYRKYETFSCWWFSLIPSRFQVILKTERSLVLPFLRNRLSKMHRVKNLNFSACAPELHSVFHVFFFARSSPSTARSSSPTHQNWASDIPMESCCKHATFPSWSFFSYSRQFKTFSPEIHLA